jgi:hypothetical protein
MIAAWQPIPERLFVAVERTTGIASLVVANGAYSVAVVLVSASLRRNKGVRAIAVGLGYAVGGAGLVLAVAGFTGSARHAAWATLPAIGLYCVWTVLVAWDLRPDGKLP